MNTMHLQDIFTYPIKSLGGIRLEEATLEERGLKYDRRWMLVDKKGKFLSQRKHPKMALLQTRISDSGILVKHK
ncbi:MAG: MOSC domain-containing protein, partial [Balneolaceae bacterium]